MFPSLCQMCSAFQWNLVIKSAGIAFQRRGMGLFSLTKRSKYPEVKRKRREPKVDINGFNVMAANLAQRDRVLRCLQLSYLRDEPLVRALRVASCATPAFYDYMLRPLAEGMSFIALGRYQNEVQGVGINATIQHNEPQIPYEMMDTIGRPCRTIVEFDDFCYRQSDLFRRYFVSHLFELRYVAVRPKYKRTGLAKIIADRGIQLAKEMRYPMACMHCTTQYMCELAESLGMTEAWSITYRDYLDHHLFSDINFPNPQRRVKVMVLNLQ